MTISYQEKLPWVLKDESGNNIARFKNYFPAEEYAKCLGISNPKIVYESSSPRRYSGR